MGEDAGPAADPARTRACPACGWSGPEELTRDAGDRLLRGCPRCGTEVAPDLPAVDEVRAARRTPEA